MRGTVFNSVEVHWYLSRIIIIYASFFFSNVRIVVRSSEKYRGLIFIDFALPAFVFYYLHVIEAPRVKSVVRYGTPEIAPRFERSYEQGCDDPSLLFHQ